jgi:hypothetical protein
LTKTLKAQVISDHLEPHEDIKNFEIARAKRASDESVRVVLNAGANTDDGRSDWEWIRLRNGDLILGVFPRGETYFEVEVDAGF